MERRAKHGDGAQVVELRETRCELFELEMIRSSLSKDENKKGAERRKGMGGELLVSC